MLSIIALGCFIGCYGLASINFTVLLSFSVKLKEKRKTGEMNFHYWITAFMYRRKVTLNMTFSLKLSGCIGG